MVGTLGDLKARIVSETVRDDLADDLKVQFDAIIKGSIEEWATQHFWFNEGRVSLTNQPPLPPDTLLVPASVRIIDALYVTIGNAKLELPKWAMNEIEEGPPQTGQPQVWAEFGGNVVLYPTPNKVYPISVLCVQDVTPPLDFANDASANAWTGVGQDLIVATSKKRLYRDYLSAIATDPRLQLAITQEGEALSALTARSNRKIATGRIRPGW